MKVLVLYYSKTGNTKRLADEIARGVREVDGIECIVRSAAEVTKEDFLTSYGVIAGSPTYFGSMAAPLKEVFDKFVSCRREMADKVGAAFATSGDPCGGRESTLLSILQALLIYGMVVVGDPLEATGHYGVTCSGAPEDKTCENANLLGKRVATLVKKLKC